MAASMGAGFMVPFGILFVGMAVYGAIYNHHNATSKDRYSLFDIVDSEEESDPLHEKYGRNVENTDIDQTQMNGTSVEYCPYCGKQVNGDFDFCPKCGKKLPD